MRSNDEQPIVTSQDHKSEPKPRAFIAGKTKVTIINKNKVPLEETNLKVLLELTGAGSNSDRPGLDIVMVIHVGENTEETKLKAMKAAVGFLIRKLSSNDCLSIVTFDRVPNRLCPLTQISDKSRLDIQKLVISGLVASSERADINAGLDMALKVIDDRILAKGRLPAIMLLSNGDQSSPIGDDIKVSVKHVPVYTFGFGRDYNAKVLDEIAKSSNGGTFSVVDAENMDSSNLSIAFSQCLAGLLTVVVQDLTLTITKVEYDIEQLCAGSYPQSEDQSTGSRSISFGHLYNKEIRKVMVYVKLPAVSDEAVDTQVLQITYTYSVKGEPFEASPIFVSITRTRQPVEQEKEAIDIEEKRLEIIEVMQNARLMADENKLDEAQDLIVETQNMLEDFKWDQHQPNPSTEILKYELLLLLRLMQSQQVYAKKGKPFALASESCHDRQRFVARGRAEKLGLFANPRRNAYLEQVSLFEEDSTKAIPNADDDANEELIKNPLEPIVIPLCYHLQVFIESVKSLQDSFKSIQDELVTIHAI